MRIRKDRISKLMDEYSNLSIKCKCGHTNFVPKFLDKKICPFCGNYVYRNKKMEFVEKLKQVKNEKKIF